MTREVTVKVRLHETSLSVDRVLT